ncbi:MAG: pseudouridine synthase [Flavobacteriales bacterium]
MPKKEVKRSNSSNKRKNSANQARKITSEKRSFPALKSAFKKRITKAKNEKQGMRLNQFLAHSGISSRREADDLIKAGLVKVNDKIITEMGYRVLQSDTVKFNNSVIKSETKRYLLLNKPKDFLMTTNDPRKKNVFELIDGACKERIYPVGRLDRQTSGLLLFTNDGELSKKLTDPKKAIKKLYHLTLDKNLKSADMQKVANGVVVDNYTINVKTISYIQNSPKREVGIETLYGRTKNIKSIFEQLGYKVLKLDQVYYGGLTKKDIPRGRHRFLSQKEINMLKMI